MASEWRQMKLGDVINLKRGFDLPTKERKLGAVPIITSSGISDYHSEAKVKGPGVATGRYGTIGSVYFCERDFWPHNTTLYVEDFKGNEPRFIYYLLHTISYTNYTDKAAVPGINRNHLHTAEVVLPDVSTQQEIAKVLVGLDDKIELNSRMNATLEAMAQALFNLWFVDFDPVKAKAKELVSAGILEIGDGYRAKNDELGEPGLPFIRAANLNNGLDTENAGRLCQESVARAGNKISRIGDIAFTSKGTIGRFARVGERTERFVYSPQVCFWRSINKAQLHPAVLYCWMQTDDFKAQVLAVAGQTDMAPYVSLRDQREMWVPQFPTAQADLGAKLEPLFARQSLTRLYPF